ncbi:diaminopimelate decarboxylase [Tissierella praeacuta DSM 18095]|uniref:Diaminopimelate decarboxylase n=1 Tax=Tissierella praeacuta DSM 18095 TaxID=1123404 RepID=A0A1M4TPQ8_9FIRM|nr:diaminopimelate decarboxylase [Tissierella praeacuta]SHE46480.1 diaminopimelate decarboxylase [Tissierella praeacuta DSM 18095]SUP04422.1 Diaminopimelate decarboxylase [Tissierella praeacuta]HAE91426.1 diaminopimelate decarboxylase [Tissierella sp.]
MSNFIFAGCDTVKLAEKYKTPLYVMSEDYIKERLKEIKKDFLEKHEKTMAVYASKAFLTKEMARIVKESGIGMDVVSGGELYTAIQVDFPMEKIIFHGNNKTIDELELAIENNVGRIVVDHLEEIDMIEEIGKKYNRKVHILFRISPGIDSHTHKYIQTGQVDSKFGIPLEEKSIKSAMEKVLKLKFTELVGFHFHIGSQISDNENHIKAIRIMAQLIKKVKDDYGFIVKELNTGGGYGIHYSENEERKPLAYFTDSIIKEIEERCKEYGLERPLVIIEPGRWVVGEAGITIYTIGAIKEIPGIRTYVSVDGGMPDNPRPSLYEAKYEAVVINKLDKEPTDLVTIAGKCCESGDILIWDLKVPTLETGDKLAVLSTGAYNYSMSSNYNRIPRPAVVMISEGKDRLIVKRETYDDILRNDI